MHALHVSCRSFRQKGTWGCWAEPTSVPRAMCARLTIQHGACMRCMCLVGRSARKVHEDAAGGSCWQLTGPNVPGEGPEVWSGKGLEGWSGKGLQGWSGKGLEVWSGKGLGGWSVRVSDHAPYTIRKFSTSGSWILIMHVASIRYSLWPLLNHLTCHMVVSWLDRPFGPSVLCLCACCAYVCCVCMRRVGRNLTCIRISTHIRYTCGVLSRLITIITAIQGACLCVCVCVRLWLTLYVRCYRICCNNTATYKGPHPTF